MHCLRTITAVLSLPGTYEIARITFPHGTVPAVYYDGHPPMLPNSSHTSQVNPDATVIIPVPEPATMGLFVVVFLAGLARNRRFQTTAHRIERG